MDLFPTTVYRTKSEIDNARSFNAIAATKHVCALDEIPVGVDDRAKRILELVVSTTAQEINAEDEDKQASKWARLVDILMKL